MKFKDDEVGMMCLFDGENARVWGDGVNVYIKTESGREITLNNAQLLSKEMDFEGAGVEVEKCTFYESR